MDLADIRLKDLISQLEVILQEMAKDYIYLKHFKPFYSVSIKHMLHKILDFVENNMLVVYKNEICFGMWGNLLANKITGYRIKT